MIYSCAYSALTCLTCWEKVLWTLLKSTGTSQRHKWKCILHSKPKWKRNADYFPLIQNFLLQKTLWLYWMSLQSCCCTFADMLLWKKSFCLEITLHLFAGHCRDAEGQWKIAITINWICEPDNTNQIELIFPCVVFFNNAFKMTRMKAFPEKSSVALVNECSINMQSDKEHHNHHVKGSSTVD